MAGPDQGRPDQGEPGGGEPATHALDPAGAVAALDDAYCGVTEMLGALSEPDFLLPTRCLGWTVTDCLYHLLGDARRALTALATPATASPDVDFVTYWEPWRPGGDGSLTRARAFRAAAAAVTAVSGPAMLVEAWRETAPAAVRLARLAPTQWLPPKATRSPSPTSPRPSPPRPRFTTLT
ncbi:MAG: maleylpyruvate isomerase N-terminal domain-containing protein [Streptosporangiaceae bacterium]